MKSAVRRVLLLSALLSPGALYALGLGEIHLNSALNQPFDADIDLVAAQEEDLSALRASLAPNDAFARYGIDKPAYLSDFTFRVVRGSDGRSYLKVTSPRPVTEPFVTMLVAADWPRGRLLREYTVLLDPPVFAPPTQASELSVAAPVVQAPRSTPSRPPAARPEPAAASAAPERQATTRPTVVAGSDYLVRRNDTLWKIASEAYPGSRSDVNRAMVAIYRSNQHAFDSNINVLRSGATLRIPEASAVDAIPASEAAAEVARQYKLWRDGSAAAESADAAGGRLRLVSPEQGSAAASTATTPEQPSATSGAEASQLQSRVQQLEAELAEARRLLEVKNAELATLQGPAAAGEPGAGTLVTPEEGTPVEGAEAPSAGALPGEAEAPVAEVAPAPTPAPTPAPEAKEPRQQPKAEQGPSLTERLAGYWWVLLGLLAAALAFTLYRRSRGDSGNKEVDLQEALARTRTDLRARGPAVREDSIVVEERRPADMRTGAAAAKPSRAPETPRGAAATDDTISGEEPVSVEAGDPLAEADFHMAYGLYDQAAELVQLAIKRAPQRRDLKLKLLEIFFVWGNRDRFVEIAREMKGSQGAAQPGEWDKIVIMGKQIAPDDEMFAAASPVASSLDMELQGSEGPLDMDLGAEQGSGETVDLESVGTADGDGGLDFDVSDATVIADASASASAATVETTRIGQRYSGSEDPTQEVAIEDLGLDMGDTETLDDADDFSDMLKERPRAAVEDTVENPRLQAQAGADEEDEDILSSTGIFGGKTGIVPVLEPTNEMPTLEAEGDTGLMPTIQTTRLPGKPSELPSGEVDFDLGDEPFTLSEVGTKLDLARAYVDMGDPEGARSILDEVVKEGSAEQKQEAERLMASLPS